MILGSIKKYLDSFKEFHFLLERIDQANNVVLYGLTGSQKSLITALELVGKPKPLLYIVENSQRGKEVFDDLSYLLPMKKIYFFPALDLLPFEVLAQSRETQEKRLETLEGLALNQTDIVITTLEAMSKALISPKIFQSGLFSLEVGQNIQIEGLLKNLVNIGYQRVDLVEDRGQISLRGGILDIYSSTGEHPYRIELFDDQIESIRLFSIDNQRSIAKVNKVQIVPFAEFFLLNGELESVINKISKEAQQLLKSMEKKGNREAYDQINTRLKEVGEALNQKQYFPGHEQFLPYFSEYKYSLIDYFSADPLIILDEPNRQREAFLLLEKERYETYKVLLEKGKVFPGQIQNYFAWEEFGEIFLKKKTLSFSLLPKKPLGFEKVDLYGLTTKTPSLFMGKTRLLVDELKEWRRQKFTTLVLVNSKERAERLKTNLWDMGLKATLVEEDIDFKPEQIYIQVGFLTNGLELSTLKLAILTEHELFFQPKKRTQRRIFEEGKKVTVLEDLKIGDYVVHTTHGIGRYLGVEKLSVGESERDYLVIKYQGEDRLYVPTEQVGLLQKYISQEGHVPKLSKLGGNEWNKIKSKVKSAVKDLAEDLLALYAAREAQQGYVFSPDSPWQMEFEETFPYEETSDQLKAIREVKRDLEKARPMDRLLCGDVGYGKTEVAIRAAFKAVTDGKQVALLVPTTVLAQQHYNTFIKRFEGFAVNVAVLSRFRTHKEQKKVIEGLKQGKIDIVIGTHRLISNDVKFKDLGLLIVDEEQRFGVVHKEKLKKLKKTVDVLTLTATPIPRTLHMSLVGVRDMSLIETPPEDRYPVQTFVVEYSPPLIREAIRRELARGGQVYYVHNRVQDIDQTAQFLQELVPEARIGIGHGQMGEENLENIMLDFMEGRIDVLVCTTIIETGLDISNVNTLIVDNADKLGLAQLYQLRGRIGRSNRVAYAYLTYTKDKILSEIAEKRLNAIREFTELGSGFKIAMRDLEIRGAGSILGAEQHGHVAAVGFDLYCRMLEEAVREAKGEKPIRQKNLSIEIEVKAFIPQEYIPDTGVKIDFYQRIYGVGEQEELEELKEELKDRFGELPQPLLNLLKIASIRTAAGKTKVQSIIQDKEVIKIRMEEDHGLQGQQLMDLTRRYRRQISFNTSGGLEIIVNTYNIERSKILDFLQELILEISTIAQSNVVLV